MIKSILRRLRQLSRRIHLRVILFATMALLALLIARWLGHLIPDDLGGNIGADAVDQILNILASSMLAVTIFSLTIMLNALTNAASLWTPRAHLILREDTVTQSVLSNFLGAYLFALVAIVMRAANLFDEREIVVLFFMSLVVVAMIVISLIRWILHLEGLGSLTFTASRLEQEAQAAIRRAAQYPCHGAHALTDPDAQVPRDALAIKADRSGYLQQIFEAALQAEAESRDLRIYIPVPVGRYVLHGEVLAWVAGGEALHETAETVLRESLPLSAVRSFEQDPLFGLSVLSEVAERALSPGVNDPGTAIDVVNRLARVLAPARVGPAEETPCDRLWAVPLKAQSLFEESLDPIARAAGDSLNVHLALQRVCHQLAAQAEHAPIREAAAAMAETCLDRAAQDITFGPDMERLRAVAG
ncbi:DUF2254 domain-containing protein [Pseudoponticoccus marisrubri]|uniref:DUF2254 domain-containing protein n=1 Tax=Pseudoponticoccus marisrubri TaxID=1685382 RepID=A0A0W7WE72_9RHOB|nr:DUF2254 domain-containing protein [Pseudoponticoccus marisrubri]KUF08870.1 hypothetical protein AVJ23_20500 [Pseudoponticoccus marisrubri]